MPRLYLFAEGQTEQTFARKLLAPHLVEKGVFLSNIPCVANARRGGRVHRGGARNYPAMKNDLLRIMNQERADDVFFTTMVDLYALAEDFPDTALSHKQTDPYARVAALEKSWAADIEDPRFIPYVQLHEFEAYLFADAEKFDGAYENAEPEIRKLLSIAKTFTSPELINEGPATAPSKRIIEVFPAYAGDKVRAGVLVAQAIGVSAIRSKCRHFDDWLGKLEALGQKACLP
jgi:hypothetical protein